jgi:PPP family 3-phenylpropionic acid transporter
MTSSFFIMKPIYKKNNDKLEVTMSTEDISRTRILGIVGRPLNSLSPLIKGSLFYLGFFVGMGMFLPFINVYWRQELGFSGRQIGLLSLIRPLMTVVFAIPVASFADRRQWRIPILMGALIGTGLVFVFAGNLHTFTAWILGWLLLAIVMSPTMSLSDSLIARMSLHHHLNYGTMRLYGSFGFALTAIVGGALWEQTGFKAMFLITGVAFLPVVFLASKLEEEASNTEQQEHPSFWTIMQNRGLIALVIASFFMGAAVNMSIIFDGIYMKFLGGTELFVGLMFGVTALCELPAMHYRDRLAERLGGPSALLLAYSIFMMTFLGYILVSRPWMLLCMAIFKGLGFGLCWVSTIQLSNERAPEHWISTIQSVISASFFGIAPLLASPLGGELYDRFGPRAVYLCGSILVSGAVMVLSAALAKRVFQQNKMIPPVV